MARELSAVLDHIAKIGELDLDDVPPTSHVVEVTGALRADEPRPCLPREVALAQAPGGERRGLPRSQPAGMSATDLLELSARAGGRGDRGGRAVAATSCSSSTARARPSTEASCREAGSTASPGSPSGAAGGVSGPLRRRAAGGQGPVLHRGRAEPVGLAHPRGLPAALHRDRGLAPERRRREPAREDQPGRVRDGLLDRELGVRARRSTRGTARACRAAPPAAARRRSRPASRRGRWAPTRAARSASRRRCAGSSG